MALFDSLGIDLLIFCIMSFFILFFNIDIELMI